MAIVELAIAIPVLIAMCALTLWVISLGGTALVLGDAARDAARALARGDSPPSFSEDVRVEHRAEAGLVTVILAQDVPVPFTGPLASAFGLAVTIEQRSSALVEIVP